jgi:putative ABC transport system substrate-binding protein
MPVRRREFISLIVGAAATWSRAVRAEPATPIIGFISTRSSGDTLHLMDSFRQGLREAGYIEGKNVAIQYRWADGHYDRLPTMLADLIGRQVEVIVAAGGVPGALAAKAATNTIPIVFISGADPVEVGLVASLNRPGGNLTGVSLLNNEVAPKLAELLHEVLPRAVTVGFLMNPTNPYTQKLLQEVQVAARGFGQQIHLLMVSREVEFEPAFATLVELRSDALLVQGDPFINSHAEQIVALATQHALPAIYPFSEYVAAGGLMSYGPSLSDAYRVVGLYSGRILKGEKPADLPVQQSTKVELIINLKAAKAFGISIPLPLLGRADEVIE